MATATAKRANGLHLLVGAGLHALVPSLVSALGARRDPFERPFVIVPHREVQTWVRRAIADESGICMNLEHGTLDDVLLYAAGLALDEPPALWEPLSLAGAIRHELAAGAEARDWLDVAGTPAEQERRRFVVARQLAELFLDYDRTHPELLLAWQRGEPGVAHPDAAWQAELWRRVCSRERAAMSPPSTVSALVDIVRRARPRLDRPVHVIGFGHFGARDRSVLAVLAGLTKVTVYFDSLVGANEWHGAEDDRPLARWGRPLQESLDALAGEAASVEWVSSASPPARSALDGLLRALVAAEGVPDSVPDDGTLVLAGAPGERREAEVVTNAVLGAVLDEGKAGAGRLSDVSVLLPRFSEQISWLEDRFDAFGALPRSVPHGGRSARLFTLVDAMLKLPSTSFERAHVLDVLLHPCFRGAASLAGASGLCAEAGIYLGADGTEGELEYLADAPSFTWAQGLDRLLLSSLMADVDELTVPALAPDALPLLELTSADEARPLFAFASSLLADLRGLAAWRAPASSWPLALEQLFRTYVEPVDDIDERALHSLLRTVERLAALAASDDEELTFAEVVAALESELATRGGGYGRPLTDGVTVGRLAVDRVVPRDVWVVTGLGEGHFPSRTRLLPWDARSAAATTWATPADLERLALLQTIFAAERRLVMTWVSKDPARDADLAPSSLLVELCTAWPALEGAIIRHPLKPYSDAYFGPGAKQRSFDAHAARTAAAMQLAVALEDVVTSAPAPGGELFDLPTWRRALPAELHERAGVSLSRGREGVEPEGKRRVSLWTFQSFLKDPADAIAAERLRMKSYTLDADAEAAVDHEPLALEPSALWTVVRKEMLWRFLHEHVGACPDEGAIEVFAAREQSRLERLGRLPFGRMRPGDQHGEVMGFLRGVAKALDQAGVWPLSLFVPVIGASRERSPLRRPVPALRLRSGGRELELTHQRSPLFRGDDKTLLLAFHGSTKPRKGADPDFRLRLELLILLLGGFLDEGDVVDTALVYGEAKGGPSVGCFRVPSRADAAAYLTGLSAQLEEGMPPYRLPWGSFGDLVQDVLAADDEALAALHGFVAWRIADEWPRREQTEPHLRTLPLRDRDGLRLPTPAELRAAAEERFRFLCDMEFTS